jgi:hypothetical protein
LKIHEVTNGGFLWTSSTTGGASPTAGLPQPTKKTSFGAVVQGKFRISRDALATWHVRAAVDNNPTMIYQSLSKQIQFDAFLFIHLAGFLKKGDTPKSSKIWSLSIGKPNGFGVPIFWETSI